MLRSRDGLANSPVVLVVRIGRSALKPQFLGRACKGGRPKPQEDGHERRHDYSTCLRDGTLVSRLGSSMRKSFALCEAFGLTPFSSPWIPSAREGLSAGTGRPGRRHSRQWRRGPPLPALRCAQRSASVATGGSARGGSQGGGGPKAPRLLQNLTPPPARLPPGNAHMRRGRGQGWGWRTTTAVRHAPVARP